jgi:hypothetical protein
MLVLPLQAECTRGFSDNFLLGLASLYTCHNMSKSSLEAIYVYMIANLDELIAEKRWR